MRNPIYICGTGNVATALIAELQRHKVSIAGVFTRMTEFQGLRICRYGVDFPEKNALVFITVPDRYIGETEKNLLKNDFCAVHTAGSMPLSLLQSQRKGVFYPMQSFSKTISTNWEGVPVFIESDDEVLNEILFELAVAFGTQPIEVDSNQREAIHLAAVFANNFANAMFGIAQEMALKAGFDPKVLNPLILQTAAKLKYSTAENMQTGPAKRGDKEVLKEHLHQLSGQPQLAEIYRVISDYLMNKYKP